MGILKYPVFYKTDESVDEVKTMLSSHCEGGWQVDLDDTGTTDDGRIQMRVVFEKESDITSLLAG